MSLRVFAACVCVASSTLAAPIGRDEVLERARAYATHPWRCTAANLRAPCSAAYRSRYLPGDYMGLPYNWGGFQTLWEFDQKMASGAGAGAYPGDGVLSCTGGVDCSGFVSKAWNSGHFSTSTLNQVTDPLAGTAALLPGDALNQAGYHVMLYTETLAGGDPVFYESIGYNVHVNATGGWSYANGFAPVRYRSITGGAPTARPDGTPDHPIPVGSLPFTDRRDTRQARSRLLDRCAAAPGTDESGAEFVYRVVVDRPGTLSVSVQDDVATDVDVHVYTSMNTGDCVARHDSSLSLAVDCGVYFVVADTYVRSGTPQAGPYTLSISLAPISTACGAGPPSYDFAGGPGEPCSYTGDDALPFCNENLGTDTCVYTSGANAVSFCSRACGRDADCRDYPGGCCRELASGENYCLIAGLCAPPPRPDAGTPMPDAGPPRPDAGPRDAGSPAIDAGTPQPDAGVPVHDAGPLPSHDAGPGRVDAGSAPDSGPDASMPVPDAGASTPDAAFDAGPEDLTPVDDVPGAASDVAGKPCGSGCSTIGAGGLALAVVGLRRRRR